ncbi:MAG TPA: GDSL-type esterase/lipase family protein [Polyangiaceae bacterium]|nr:GDSL-type esterase/lipase family protein [Polyangiaceae bacterium]
MSPVRRERFGSLAVAVAAAAVAATCSREGRLEPRAPATPSKAAQKSAPPRPSSQTPLPAPPALSSSAPAAASAAPRDELPKLEHFYAALAGLANKTRKEPARILWLGDSHTAADFMTGALRRKLSQRFGPGGPGLVRVGANSYRHEGVKVVRDGRWKIEPDPPSRRTTEGDTALGFEGLRAIPVDAHARLELRIDGRAVAGTVRYELVFELPRGASFRLKIGKNEHLIDGRTPLDHVAGSPLSRLHLEGAASDGFEVSQPNGGPRFYGVLAEGSEPGVVLDTSGIDGARVATALAWNADVFAAELRARQPDLVAFAYGTNEAFDNRRAEIIGNDMSELVARVRKGVPSADCLVVGPPDAAAPDLTSLPHVVEIEDALGRAAARTGCGFFSLRAAMGGDGAFVRWMREVPALARGDRIHLTPPGYERLGEAVAEALLTGYERSPK